MQRIGILRTPFTDKFGIPRQPGLVAAEGRLDFEAPFDDPLAIRGLAAASHVWLIWQFHAVPEKTGKDWQRSVRPPRLGGNQRVGVFASRSGFRPNRLGLSVCELSAIADNGSLHLRGVDMLDGTPVLDVKPYVPYADAVPDARMDWAEAAPAPLPVTWAEGIDTGGLSAADRGLIEAVLAQDPRPAYQQAGREYGMDLAGFRLRFQVAGGRVTVTQLLPASA